MKHVYLAFSLALLLFAVACDSMSNQKENEKSQPLQVSTVEVKSGQSQGYFTLEENQPAIVGEIKDGGLWLTFHQDQILPVGIVDEDSYRLPDGPIQVEGLKGSPKNFIIADIGQDYNPILCVLTDEGKVQVLCLWNTVVTGDIEATEIPMEGIINFKDGPGGPWEDEDGTVYYEYTTIYGIDSKGTEHEIPLYMLDNNLEYVEKGTNADVVYQLFLTDDWKMQYVVGYFLSEKVEELQGRFWLISEDWDEMVFRFGYELTTDIDYTGEQINTTKVNRTGVFEVQYPDFESGTHIIIPIEGIDFANKGMNVPVPFNPADAYEG